MSSFGARAAFVLMRGARSGGLVLMGFNAWPPCEQKIAPKKGATFYLLLCILVDLDKRVIQQEVDDADIEDAVVIIPTLANVMTHDNLREGIAGQREGLILGDCLFLRSKRISRLNVGLLTAGGCNEVDFPRNRHNSSFGIFLIAIDNANVNGAFTDHQLIKNDVLHYVRHFLLAEADTGISQSNVCTVVFVGIVKIALALDIPAFAFGEEEGIR